jgi:hypothetical protein
MITALFDVLILNGRFRAKSWMDAYQVRRVDQTVHSSLSGAYLAVARVWNLSQGQNGLIERVVAA